MDTAYREHYAALYRTHWWWRAREAFLTRLLARVLAPGSAGDILDFGCGDGLFFPVLERFGRPFGVELDAGVVTDSNAWRGQITHEWTPHDGAEAGRYGLIVALDVLEHIEDPKGVTDEFRRRLRPGGWCLVTAPAFQALWTSHDDLNHHCRRYTRRQLESLLRDSGFEIADSRYFFVWVAVAKWLLARLESFRPRRGAPPTVPPAAINAALYGLCRAEMYTFGIVRPPFGSSVVVLARAPRQAQSRPQRP